MLEKLTRDAILHLILFSLVVTNKRQACDKTQKNIESLFRTKKRHNRNFKEWQKYVYEWKLPFNSIMQK